MGHAEDALALTFATYALIAMLDGKWTRCGWLMGFGIVMQPLVLLLLPLLIGASPAGRRALLAIRSLALSTLLVGVAFAGAPGDTYRAVVKQPEFPVVNHVTPWLALAPRLSDSTISNAAATVLRYHRGHFVQSVAAVPTEHILVVTGGTGRSLYLVLAMLVGVYVWRRPQSPVNLLWWAAVILVARCFFEAVMCPYYLAPPLFLALVMTARMGRRRFWTSVAIAAVTSAYSYLHLSPWLWFVPVVCGLAVVLALGYPGRSDPSGSRDEAESTAHSDEHPDVSGLAGQRRVSVPDVHA
jgi:hypothetical protein